MLLAFKEQTDVVIVAKDTDVPVLLVWAYSFYNVKYKYKVMCDYVGKYLCLSLQAFHSLTGCDTTSYFFRTGKVRAFKKVLPEPTKLSLLASLGKVRNNIKDVKKFVRKVVYASMWIQEYADTKIYHANH